MPKCPCCTLLGCRARSLLVHSVSQHPRPPSCIDLHLRVDDRCMEGCSAQQPPPCTNMHLLAVHGHSTGAQWCIMAATSRHCGCITHVSSCPTWCTTCSTWHMLADMPRAFPTDVFTAPAQRHLSMLANIMFPIRTHRSEDRCRAVMHHLFLRRPSRHMA